MLIFFPLTLSQSPPSPGPGHARSKLISIQVCRCGKSKQMSMAENVNNKTTNLNRKIIKIHRNLTSTSTIQPEPIFPRCAH